MCTRLGDPSVLEFVEKPIPEPEDGEVRIRVLVSGVNPTDWKSRSGAFGGALTEATVPNHDGAGVIDAVGAGVTGFRMGDRVWSPMPATAVRREAPRRSSPSSPPNAPSRSLPARTLSSEPASASRPSPRTGR